MKESFTFVAVAALVFASCAPPTAITVDVYSEVCADDVEVSLTVAPDLGSLKGQLPSSTTRGCVEGRAGNVVIAPADDREKPLAFAIATREGKEPIEDCLESPLPKDCIVARRQLRFSPNQDLQMRVDLRLACQGIECPAEQTCVKGACVPAEVEPDRCLGGCDEATLPLPPCAPAKTYFVDTILGEGRIRLVDTPSGPVAAGRKVEPPAIHLQRLAFDGALQGLPSAPIPAAYNIDFVDLAYLLGFDGAGHVLLHRDGMDLMFQKVDLQGNALVGPYALMSSYRPERDAMAWSGTRFALWVSDPPLTGFDFVTMDPSGKIDPPQVLTQVYDAGNVAWNGTNFGASWRDVDGGCYVTILSADGMSGEPSKVVAESCQYPADLSWHPQGWNYVYSVDGRIEYVQLDPQGSSSAAPVVISPQDAGVYATPRSVSLASGKTWVTFPDGAGKMYATLLESGNVLLPAAPWPEDATVSFDEYGMVVVGDRVHLVYKGTPAGRPIGVYSTVLCDGSAP